MCSENQPLGPGLFGWFLKIGQIHPVPMAEKRGSTFMLNLS